MKKLAVVVVLSLLTGCSSQLAWKPPSQAPTRLPAVPKSVSARPGVPCASVSTKSGMLMGAYEADAPRSWSGLSEFATKTGTKPRIALYYSEWNSGFNATFAKTARSHGATVYDQLQPTGVTLTSIAAGSSDSYLHTYARQLQAFGCPVILSFAHEMNGNWYPWGAGHVSPSDFIAAWRHIVQLFRGDGVSNVTWVWSVNDTTTVAEANSLRQWWPGSAWVNWVGIDGYYYFKGDTYHSVFGETIAKIRTFSRAPVMISETAVGVTSDRESQIAALFAGARSDHLAAVVWFDKAQNSGVYHQDWRLEDDPAALRAFKAALRS
jgi:mannan endo-1,4-beta-mannosidase